MCRSCVKWAALIKQVYEVDPLSCPKCGAEMKIIRFIERHQTEVTCPPAGRSRRFSGTAGYACLPKPRRRQGRRRPPGTLLRSRRREWDEG